MVLYKKLSFSYKDILKNLKYGRFVKNCKDIEFYLDSDQL